MNFIVGYHTDVGIRKNVNQDAILIKTAKSPYGRIGLFVICDGMGGLALGEVASSTAVRDISIWFDEKLPDSLQDQTGEIEIVCFNSSKKHNIVFPNYTDAPKLI